MAGGSQNPNQSHVVASKLKVAQKTKSNNVNPIKAVKKGKVSAATQASMREQLSGFLKQEQICF